MKLVELLDTDIQLVEIVMELVALFDTVTEFPESLDDTIMELARLLDIKTEFP